MSTASGLGAFKAKVDAHPNGGTNASKAASRPIRSCRDSPKMSSPGGLVVIWRQCRLPYASHRKYQALLSPCSRQPPSPSPRPTLAVNSARVRTRRELSCRCPVRCVTSASGSANQRFELGYRTAAVDPDGASAEILCSYSTHYFRVDAGVPQRSRRQPEEYPLMRCLSIIASPVTRPGNHDLFSDES